MKGLVVLLVAIMFFPAGLKGQVLKKESLKIASLALNNKAGKETEETQAISRRIYYIKGIAYSPDGKIIISPNAKLTYNISSNKTNNLTRIDLKLENCVLNPRLELKNLERSTFIKEVTVKKNYTKGSPLTITLILKPSFSYKRAYENSNPFQIILEVSPSNGVSKTISSKDRANKNRVFNDSYWFSGEASRKASSQGIKTIVIDPGHGGNDKGATGLNNSYEKDLTLELAVELKKFLEEMGYTVLLTRTSDRYLSLKDRVKIANQSKADFFISLHFNAHQDPSVRGFETYFLNVSSDKESSRVAAIENAIFNEKMSEVEVILEDLLKVSCIAESARLARAIHSQIISIIEKNGKTVKDLGVKSAPFYVLFGINMPGILLEAGFITNEEDFKLIKEAEFKKALAKGIARGIQRYFAENRK